VPDVVVSLGENSYRIHLGSGILPQMGSALRSLGVSKRMMVVTNPVVGGLYGVTLADGLKRSGFEAVSTSVPDGEEYKSLEVAGQLYDQLISNRLDRRSALIALGVLISTYGYLAGQFVSVPRLTFAFAEQRDFPKFFREVHKRFRTPYVSILIYTALVWGLAIYGSFIWNAILSAVARLFTYGIVCAALLRLRRLQPEEPSFRLPAGWLASLLGMAFCALMVTQMGSGHLKIMLVIAAVALVNWLWVRSKIKFGDR